MSDYANCPICRSDVLRDPSAINHRVTCPVCHRVFVMPPAEPPVAAPVVETAGVSSRVRPRREKRVWTKPAMVFSVAALAGVLLAAAVRESDSYERYAVRDYLSANLDDPQYAEVQWWPARSWFTPEELAAARQVAESRGSEPPENYRIIRLKYRSRNDVGAMELFDRVFEIRDDGVARPARRGNLVKDDLFDESVSPNEVAGNAGLRGFVSDMADGKFVADKESRETSRREPEERTKSRIIANRSVGVEGAGAASGVAVPITAPEEHPPLNPPLEATD